MRRPPFALWPDQRTVWRWHFLAGLFCLPFVAFLCLTGTIYLFKPQVDDWIDRRQDHLAVVGPAATAEAQVHAALAAMPNSRLLAYELPRGPNSAVHVIVDRGGAAVRVYVHPSSLAILKRVREEDRFERIVFKLHGQLLLGNVGSAIMEMVASWTIVLIVTGLYLWWPRNGAGAAGVAFPRLATPGRRRWRDLHAVTGLWVSLFLALFLVSGLPWSFVWGHVLARVESSVSRLTTIQGWEIGAQPMRDVVAGRPVAAVAPMRRGMAASMPGMDMDAAAPADADALAGLDAVVATGRSLDFPFPVLVTPPAPGSKLWRVRSDTQDRPRRIAATVTATGAVVSVDRFARKGFVDRAVGYGVAAHEGHLFGWPNVVLNLFVAAGLMTMSVAAIVLWLRRKPPGRVGVPPVLPGRHVGPGAVAVMLVLGVLLPELGASLLILLLGAIAMGSRHARRAARETGA